MILMKVSIFCFIVFFSIQVFSDTMGPLLPGVQAYNRYNTETEQKNDAYWDLAWHARMADYGDPESQYILAQAYEKGINTVENPVKALYFYKRSCQGNYPQACMILAQQYLLYDKKEKALWALKKGASLDYVPAQLELSKFYEKDNEMILAHFWLKKALQQLFPGEKNLEEISPDLAYLTSYLLIEDEVK